MHIRILLSLIALTAAPLAAQERPNILLIVVDDQSPFDLGIYESSSKCRTPVIDALAARGIRGSARVCRPRLADVRVVLGRPCKDQAPRELGADL